MQTSNDNTSPISNTRNETAPGNEKVEEALKQAEHDIEEDPDFKPDPNDDLDEGEIARLGDDDETDQSKE